MFGLCQDRFTKEIYRRGYCLVPLPDSSIKPLEVLGRQGGDPRPAVPCCRSSGSSAGCRGTLTLLRQLAQPP